ncbi:hypothetical protein HHL19_13895 [Streptomyces sp. R302]|uniref:hypothetical protein n=1 Tax=unclassified Streptomyces TaxID=2593676 RepID=UPI00145D33CB|nr:MULTISPECIES: hypothetical protein [unclassified Streptomyces]NML51165.1 hypothetical protein [Streptomyces sp. R301]NML79743.1 hypothetical protein [Streptomyces sp. R302]
MSTFNFNNSQVSGNAFGERNEVTNHFHQAGADGTVTARALAEQLVTLLREQPAATTAVVRAETVRDELAAAEQENRPADEGRVRTALAAVEPYVTVGSGGMALLQGILAFFGG